MEPDIAAAYGKAFYASTIARHCKSSAHILSEGLLNCSNNKHDFRFVTTPLYDDSDQSVFMLKCEFCHSTMQKGVMPREFATMWEQHGVSVWDGHGKI